MVKKKKESQMTDEERIAFEEQKRYAEEEVRKKREDVLIQFLKDKLMKEEKATYFNMNKLNYQWRNIMRQAKAKELVKDIEILSQTFERVIDSKDAVLKSLFTDIAEAEEQYALALRSHLQKIDFLMDLQIKRIESLNQAYALELEIICEEFDLERSILIEQHASDMANIADIIFAMEEEFQVRENEAFAEYQSMRDEIKNKNLEDKHSLKVQLEAKIDDLWQQFRHALHTYHEMNEERKNTFEHLKQKDSKNTKEIELQMRKLQRIADQIAHIRTKMAASAKESEERNRTLKEDDDSDELTRADKERVQQHFQVLKAEMNQIRDCQREKLTRLTIESNTTIKTVKQQKKMELMASTPKPSKRPKSNQFVTAEKARELHFENFESGFSLSTSDDEANDNMLGSSAVVLKRCSSSPLLNVRKHYLLGHLVLPLVESGIRQGEQILRLAEMCRKLETEEEKVLPFFASSLTREEEERIKEAMLEPPAHHITEVMHQCSELENFWKRYNKVLLDKLSLDKEKRVLTDQNHRLRMLLKQYLDGISVNEEVLSQANPLMVVNNRTNLRMKDGRNIRKSAPRTIVEAAHIVKHTLT